MGRVRILANIQGRKASELYPVLCDFRLYPRHTDAVREVILTNTEDARVTSKWEVNFRQGILRWTEEDRFDFDKHTIHFQQIEGDIDDFSGDWSLEDTADGCLLKFSADFDMGMPGLSDFIEPIAEKALCDNIRSIIAGILLEPVEFTVETSTSIV